MWNGYVEELNAEARRQHLLQLADHARLVQEVRAARRSAGPPWWERFMKWPGFWQVRRPV